MTEKPSLLKELKRVFLFFCFSFILVFLILNIIQFFNFMGRQAAALIETSPQILSQALPITTNSPEQREFPLTEKENSLEIKKLGVEAPMIFSKSANIKEIAKDLLRGVAAYPGSGSPGEKGKMFILGHSAPPGFPKLKYYWVFSKLNDLETGDEIFINFEKRQYRYLVTKKMFLEKGQAIPESDSNGSKEFLYLVTCWPPGKDFKRLVVEAELTLTR